MTDFISLYKIELDKYTEFSLPESNSRYRAVIAAKSTAVSQSVIDTNSYNLVFTQIPKSAYDTKISARAYAVINGQVYYSEIKTYCVNDVITSIMNDDEISQEIKDNIKTEFNI